MSLKNFGETGGKTGREERSEDFSVKVEGWVTPPFGDINLDNLAQAFTAI